jgi:hypothetical protein
MSRPLTGTLIDVIDRLDTVDDSDRLASLVVYAEGGADATASARAAVCAGDDNLSCPQDPRLSEVLMVRLAKDAIEVWSEWRGGRIPNAQEKLEAVLFYSRNDAYLPVEHGS